jgi:hypothetical protein
MKTFNEQSQAGLAKSKTLPSGVDTGVVYKMSLKTLSMD